jgi:hypothetical protein
MTERPASAGSCSSELVHAVGVSGAEIGVGRKKIWRLKSAPVKGSERFAEEIFPKVSLWC